MNEKYIPQHFIYDDEFYHEIEDLATAFEDSADSLPDVLTCYKTSLEPIVRLSAGWILERIDDDRFNEDGEPTDRVLDILKTIDFTAVNEKMPKLHYQTNSKFTITKAEIVAIINEDRETNPQ